MSALTLDPFALYPGRESRIAGLSGADRGSDTFAFHTSYVRCGEAPIRFRVRFDSLHATAGTLVLRVNEHSGVDGAPTSLAAHRQHALAEVAAGEASIDEPLFARPGMVYAL